MILQFLGDFALAFALAAPPEPLKIAPPPAPKANALRSADCNCPPYNCQCSMPCRCAAPAKPTETAKPEPPKLQYWRLADDTGQVWQWSDREGLILWVKARNAKTTTPPIAAYSPQFQAIPQGFSGFSGASACGPQGCN